jgi:hypothetical protein
MQGKFTLSIELGNDAMRKRRDIARALRNVAARLTEGAADDGKIRDENGNTVGEWHLDRSGT